MSTHSENQARAQLESIKEMVERYMETADSDEIWEDPLSVQVRSGWHSPGSNPEPEEFHILLCTGGPAVAIFGELDEYGQPYSATLMHQDWFEPWQPLDLTAEETETLHDYCRVFYFGE